MYGRARASGRGKGQLMVRPSIAGVITCAFVVGVIGLADAWGGPKRAYEEKGKFAVALNSELPGFATKKGDAPEEKKFLTATDGERITGGGGQLINETTTLGSGKFARELGRQTRIDEQAGENSPEFKFTDRDSFVEKQDLFFDDNKNEKKLELLQKRGGKPPQGASVSKCMYDVKIDKQKGRVRNDVLDGDLFIRTKKLHLRQSLSQLDLLLVEVGTDPTGKSVLRGDKELKIKTELLLLDPRAQHIQVIADEIPGESAKRVDAPDEAIRGGSPSIFITYGSCRALNKAIAALVSRVFCVQEVRVARKQVAHLMGVTADLTMDFIRVDHARTLATLKTALKFRRQSMGAADKHVVLDQQFLEDAIAAHDAREGQKTAIEQNDSYGLVQALYEACQEDRKQ